MRTFIRENLMIVVSIALPVLVVVLFAAASVIPRLLTEAPTHDVLLVVDSPAAAANRVPANVRIEVEEGRVQGRVFQLEDGRSISYLPHLFRYESANSRVREIPIRLPDDVRDLPDGSIIPIPELESLYVSTSPLAPDGYEFDQTWGGGGGGLFRELFGGSRQSYSARVRKNGAVVTIRLPSTGPYYYYSGRFVGWIIE